MTHALTPAPLAPTAPATSMGSFEEPLHRGDDREGGGHEGLDVEAASQSAAVSPFPRPAPCGH